jgi:hypothetical protein
MESPFNPSTPNPNHIMAVTRALTAPLAHDRKPSSDSFQRPNFPPLRQDGFILEVEANQSLPGRPSFFPLRPQSNSGKPLPLWELHCKSLSGASPRQFPHPVLGEWISALRYTGLSWLEVGLMAIAAGFSEEGVIAALWEALPRLMERNGVSFLIGTAPTGSLALDMALRSGARVLEPFTAGASRYFLYVK